MILKVNNLFMTLIAFVYKSVRKAWRILYVPYYHIATLIMLHANKVQFGSFHTYGIPIVGVSHKEGGKIIIGNNLRMNNGDAANNIGFTSRCVLRAERGATLCIGENVGMSQTALCAIGADITIGKNTQLGGGVKIYSSNFHSLNYIDRQDPRFADINNCVTAPVVVGDDCFIGAGVIILKGVTIGDRTVIGAGSVVVKPIPSDCIAVGNPCVMVKKIN